MDIIVVLYLIVSLSLSLTAYLNIYRPAETLVAEVTGTKTHLNGATGFIIWSILTTVLAPLLVILLLYGDNEQITTRLAISLMENRE